MSGSMSGMWKRSKVNLVRPRQTKEPETDRGNLNHRATSRLYRRYPSQQGYKGVNGGGVPWNYLRSESIWGRQPFIWQG